MSPSVQKDISTNDLLISIQNSELSDTKRIKALVSLLKCMKQEVANSNIIQVELFNSILGALLVNDIPDKLFKKFVSYLDYSDFRYFTLKYLNQDFLDANTLNDVEITNILNLFIAMPCLDKLKSTTMPQVTQIEDQSTKEDLEMIDIELADMDEPIKEEMVLFFLNKENLSGKSKICIQDNHRKLYNDCIVSFLKYQLNPKQYKQLLLKLPDKIMPKMSNPLMLAGFLTQSYNIGGLISVLALNSLFVLINGYNLEYPHFYMKVYQLLDSSIFLSKYKDRFFRLLDTFLLSTHLSANLVGSFIKKLSRMTLTCPPGDLLFLILFCYNIDSSS